VGGANFVVISLAKTYWSLTFKVLEKRVEKNEKNCHEEKEKSIKFRHDYSTTLNALADELKHQGEMTTNNFKYQAEIAAANFKSIDAKIDSIKEVLQNRKN